MLHSIEKQIQRANTYREKKHKQKVQVDTEVGDYFNFAKSNLTR